MALKPDERALLQLLCERGQSYADIAELLGDTEDVVRAKARAALAELGGADPDVEVALTDYLLGQADPIGRADAVRHLQQDDGARELAGEIITKLQALAPAAELPRLPEDKGARRKAAAPSPSEAETEAGGVSRRVGVQRGSGVPALGSHQGRVIAGIGAAAIVLVFIVLAIAGVFSGDDSTAPTTAEDPDAAGNQSGITEVALDPVDGSGVAGRANFGLTGDTLFVDLDLDGLDPDATNKEVYLMWFMLADGAGYPIPTPIQPDQNGAFQDRIPIAAPVALAVAGAAETVRISQSKVGPLTKAVEAAATGDDPNLVVPFTGTALASGEIPLVEAPDTGGGTGGESGGGAGGGNGGGGNNAGG